MRDQLNLYRLSDATFYDRINTIYQFVKPFLDKKYLLSRKYGAFNEKFLLQIPQEVWKLYKFKLKLGTYMDNGLMYHVHQNQG